MGLRKGAWTKEEDQILISHISEHGHENWRALPKKAGLLRCGKSCRLRWTNYLRPDIKRGNFTKEEEDTIIQLHQSLGNRWSKIAGKLPGRTDNEIKNVWHTHLKKRLKVENTCSSNSINETSSLQFNDPRPVDFSPTALDCRPNTLPRSPSSSAASSSVTALSILDDSNAIMVDATFENFPKLENDFWLSEESSFETSITNGGESYEFDCGFNQVADDDMKFWRDLFTRAEELHGSPDFVCSFL